MSAPARQRSQPAQSPDFLASVSDLMSGLIFIFIITVAVFALRLAKATTELNKATTELTNADALRTRVVETIADELRKKDIAVTIDPEQGVLRLTDRAISFPRGASEPQATDHRNVGVVANVLLRVLQNHVAGVKPVEESRARAERPWYCEPSDATTLPHPPPPDSTGAKVNTVLVEGHTDSVPIASGSRFRDNLGLSAARSAEVFRMMLQCEPGLSSLANRTESPVLSVSGYGETRPIDRQQGEADANRRIDLRFLMEPPEAEAAGAPPAVEEMRRELEE